MKRGIIIIALIITLSIGYFVYTTEGNELEKRVAISKVMNSIAKTNNIPAYDLSFISLKDKFLSNKYLIELEYINDDVGIVISVDDTTGEISNVENFYISDDTDRYKVSTANGVPLVKKQSNNENGEEEKKEEKQIDLVRVTGVSFNKNSIDINGTIGRMERKVNYQVYNHDGEILYGDSVKFTKDENRNNNFNIKLEDKVEDINLIEFFTIGYKEDDNKVSLYRFYIEPFGKGRVINVLDNKIVVEGKFNKSHKAISIYYLLVDKDTLIVDNSNEDVNNIELEDLKEGEWIEVWLNYPYKIEESKPPTVKPQAIRRVKK